MSELFPKTIVYNTNAQGISTTATDTTRTTIDTRPFLGTYNNQMAQGASAAANIRHAFFYNGNNWDLSQSTTTTTYTFSVPSGTFVVFGVMLEMITSKSAVLNGNSFGGQFLGGLLGNTLSTPGPLTNGLVLKVTSAGTTITIYTLFTNEDFGLGQYPIAGGSLTGGVYTFRARYEMRQPLVSGTSDAMTWTVQDNMMGRGISELRTLAFGFVQ